jgi:hypothetical protein
LKAILEDASPNRLDKKVHLGLGNLDRSRLYKRSIRRIRAVEDGIVVGEPVPLTLSAPGWYD